MYIHMEFHIRCVPKLPWGVDISNDRCFVHPSILGPDSVLHVCDIALRLTRKDQTLLVEFRKRPRQVGVSAGFKRHAQRQKSHDGLIHWPAVSRPKSTLIHLTPWAKIQQETRWSAACSNCIVRCLWSPTRCKNWSVKKVNVAWHSLDGLKTVSCWPFCHISFTESAIFSDAVRSEYQQSLGALSIHGCYPDGVFWMFSFLAELPLILSACLWWEPPRRVAEEA